MEAKEEKKGEPGVEKAPQTVEHLMNVERHDRNTRTVVRGDESLVTGDVLAPDQPKQDESLQFHGGAPANEARVQVSGRRMTARGIVSVDPETAVKVYEEARKREEDERKKQHERIKKREEKLKNARKGVEKAKEHQGKEPVKAAEKQAELHPAPVVPADSTQKPVAVLNQLPPDQRAHELAKTLPGATAVNVDPLPHPEAPKPVEKAKPTEESKKVEAPDGNRPPHDEKKPEEKKAEPPKPPEPKKEEPKKDEHKPEEKK